MASPQKAAVQAMEIWCNQICEVKSMAKFRVTYNIIREYPTLLYSLLTAIDQNLDGRLRDLRGFS